RGRRVRASHRGPEGDAEREPGRQKDQDQGNVRERSEPSSQGRPEEEPKLVCEERERSTQRLSSPEPAASSGALDDGRRGLLRESQKDVLEAPFGARLGLIPQRLEVSGRDVASVIHDGDAP